VARPRARGDGRGVVPGTRDATMDDRRHKKVEPNMNNKPVALRLLMLVMNLLRMFFVCGFIGPAIAQPTKPNILFAIADDWGVHGGAYGTKWVQTPTLDRIAREGLLFRNAFTPTAKCAPSRACILTGRNPWQLEDAGNHQAYFPAKFKSWPEALMENGWTVGITGKGWGPGEANDANGKPRQITGIAYNQRKLKPLTTGISNNDYAANFVDFLDAVPEGKQWCFWYGATEPHRNYQFQSGVKLGGKQLSDIDEVPGYWPDQETVRHDMLDYGLEVEHVDSQLAKMMAELERRGLLENTLVIFTSDHGMPFPRAKGYAYFDSNHVPLAIRWPKGIQNAGRSIDDYVSFIDIAATLLDVAGLDGRSTGMADITGISWRAIFDSPRAGQVVAARDHVLLGKERTDVGRPGDVGYPIRGMIGNGYLYLKNYEPTRWPAGNPETGYLDTDGSPTKSLILEMGRRTRSDPFWQWNFGMRPDEELYDLTRDRYCIRNLSALPEHQSRSKQMLDQMQAELRLQNDPRMSGNGKIFDEYRVANPNSNFYERRMKGEKVKAGWVNESDFEDGPIK
jgi:N-sulfoglucosamine sulfohydrolase